MQPKDRVLCRSRHIAHVCDVADQDMNHAVRIPVEDRTKADVAGRAVDISRLAERAQIEGTVILVIYPLACIDPGIATGLIERAGSVAKGFRNGKIGRASCREGGGKYVETTGGGE